MPSITPITQGDSPTLRFTVVNQAGDPFDLTDYVIEFLIKRSMQDTDAAAEFLGDEAGAVVVPFEQKDGIVDVTVSVAATTALRVGRPYFWFLRLTNEFDASDVITPERGQFLTTLPNTLPNV